MTKMIVICQLEYTRLHRPVGFEILMKLAKNRSLFYFCLFTLYPKNPIIIVVPNGKRSLKPIQGKETMLVTSIFSLFELMLSTLRIKVFEKMLTSIFFFSHIVSKASFHRVIKNQDGVVKGKLLMMNVVVVWTGYCPTSCAARSLINPLPHMPVLGSSTSAANKDMMSKIWTNKESIT